MMQIRRQSKKSNMVNIHLYHAGYNRLPCYYTCIFYYLLKTLAGTATANVLVRLTFIKQISTLHKPKPYTEMIRYSSHHRTGFIDALEILILMALSF